MLSRRMLELGTGPGEGGHIMSRQVEERSVNGNKLTCPVCGHDRFWFRTTLMNTRGATFLGFDWANKEAENYVCGQCGYVMWFMPS